MVTEVARQEENSSKTSPRLRNYCLHRSVREQNPYTLFIIIRISEPEDYVVQLRTDAGDVVKGKSLINDGIHADMPSARRIRGEVPDILNRSEGRHRQFGQEDRKCRIRPQAFGMQIQRIHAPMSSLGKTATVAAGFGIEVQFAIASEAGTRSKLNGQSCACALWMTGTNVDSKPKAAMMVARTFELITDCLVCMGSFFLGLICVLVFSGVFMFCRFMCESAEPASNPPRLRSFFLRCRAWLVVRA